MANVMALLTPPVYDELMQLYSIEKLSKISASILHKCEPIQKHPLLTHPQSSKAIRKALCLKLVLCARMDSQQSHSDGSYGHQYYALLEKRKNALEAPKEIAREKPMVIHTEMKSRRGGRRKRRVKWTDEDKEKNKIAFGKAEKDVYLSD